MCAPRQPHDSSNMATGQKKILTDLMEFLRVATVWTLLSLASLYCAGMGKGQTEGPGLCMGLPPRLDSCDKPTNTPRSADSLHHHHKS